MKENTSFDVIYDEIKRQYNLQIIIDNSHDTKAGILLGFIIVVLTQITLCEEFLNSIIPNKVLLTIFIVGFLSILYAGYCGIRIYFTKKYNIGPDISDLIEQYRKGENREYNKVIARKINDAFDKNKSVSKKKVDYIKKMFVAFFVGFVLIIIPKIIFMVI